MLPGEACLLTFHMGKEVVSEWGVGAGVAVGGAEAAGAQEGPLHTRRQQLCAARTGGGQGGDRKEEQKLTQEQGRCHRSKGGKRKKKQNKEH